ncbi:MAG: cellulase family glycosylhydrolase [Clostridia bacterium]|nr:cellulase family glycosylhydrolase [Clostridia bacterium]
MLKMEASKVKGFNYHPGYSTGAMEDWLLFDYAVWERDLTKGKELFPGMNTIRIWLSWNAYCRLGERFIGEVRQVVELCKRLDLFVVPCLFNRWHDPMVDCDGVYIDHFLPNSSWLQKYGDPFGDYMDALAQEFRDEEQILVWDICNEPFAYNPDFPLKEVVQKYELEWLRRMAERLRADGVTQPLGIGSTGDEPMATFEDIFDVYLTHMYYRGGSVAEFEETVKRFAEEAKVNGRPLITSECCWGAFDDKQRVDMMEVSLRMFQKHGVGYIAHALCYSGCADLHDPCDGRVTEDIGNLCFINKDGTLRPYHDIINRF